MLRDAEEVQLVRQYGFEADTIMESCRNMLRQEENRCLTAATHGLRQAQQSENIPDLEEAIRFATAECRRLLTTNGNDRDNPLKQLRQALRDCEKKRFRLFCKAFGEVKQAVGLSSTSQLKAFNREVAVPTGASVRFQYTCNQGYYSSAGIDMKGLVSGIETKHNIQADQNQLIVDNDEQGSACWRFEIASSEFESIQIHLRTCDKDGEHGRVIVRGGRRGDVQGTTVNYSTANVPCSGWQWLEVELHLEKSAFLRQPFEVRLCVRPVPQNGGPSGIVDGIVDMRREYEKFQRKVGACLGSISRTTLKEIFSGKLVRFAGSNNNNFSSASNYS